MAMGWKVELTYDTIARNVGVQVVTITLRRPLLIDGSFAVHKFRNLREV